MLQSGEPDFPFLICWANENWTRRWDGKDREILLAQSHSVEDDRNHLRSLAPAFADSRYFRLNGRPVFLVYRTDLLPNARETADTWRDEAHRLGLGDITLGRVENFGGDVDPRDIGFDFAVEFAPRWTPSLRRQLGSGAARILRQRGLLRDGHAANIVYEYRDLVEAMTSRPTPGYDLFRCACPSWDNTPRRKRNATVFHGATPALFQQWLEMLLADPSTFQGQRTPIFLNAWNEWAEGAQLEPCSVFGRAFLEAIRSALSATVDLEAVAQQSR